MSSQEEYAARSPEKATYNDVILTYQLVGVDTLGPINPPALGDYRYVITFVDQRTKWKQIFLMRDKTHTIYSIALYKEAVVIPSGTKLEFFFPPNMPQQIDANERAGTTLANMVR